MSEEKNDKWEMPEPVFRSSEGSLPRSLEETISQSYMPNAETLEIDEDDDILSIMDTPYKPEPVSLAADFDHDKTIEIEPDIFDEEDESEPETASVSETETVEEIPTEDADHKPIVVTAKYPDEKAAAASGDSSSNLFQFVVMALIAAGVVIGVYYYFSTP